MSILSDMLKSVGKAGGEAAAFPEKLVFGASAALAEVPVIGGGFRTPIGPRERAFRKKYGGSLGRGRRAEDTAPDLDMTTIDQWNAATMAEYAQASLIPEFQTRIQKQGGFAEGDMDRLLSITSAMNPQAGPQDTIGLRYQMVQSQIQTAAMEGWLDDPEGEQLFDAMIALNAQDQQFQLNDQGVPKSDMEVQAEKDMEDQSYRAQIEFERAGVTDFLQMLPAQIRVQAIISMIDKPFFQRLFLGGMEGGISGGGSAGGPPTTLQETADFLGSFGSR